MLAVALGRAACEAGYRVYYTSAADLAARCHRAAIEGRWATVMRFFCQPAVLIVDELGCAPRGAIEPGGMRKPTSGRRNGRKKLGAA